MTSTPPSSTSPIEARLSRSPVATVLALEVAALVLTIGGAALLGALLPSLPGYSVTGPSQSLVLVVVLAALLMVLVAVFGWWDLGGFTRPSRWRDLRLYWFAALLLLVPLVGGVRVPEASAIGVLLIGYLVTGLWEEGMWRGVVLGLLRTRGVWFGVVVSSLLFGLAHLGNSALRGFSVLVVLQALGAALQGVGLAALRLRTNTIWPLILLHALHDISLQLGVFPIAAVEAPIDTAMCLYGIYLLRRR